MHKLMEFICDEMEELERKAEKDGKLTMQEVQYLDTLAHTKKNLLKADEMWDESEYSMAGDRSYARDRRMNRNNMSYARGRGRNARRDAMGRYSRDGYSMAEDDFKMELQDLMQDAPNEQVKMKLQRMMSEM
jgi:hypothetical protein